MKYGTPQSPRRENPTSCGIISLFEVRTRPLQGLLGHIHPPPSLTFVWSQSWGGRGGGNPEMWRGENTDYLGIDQGLDYEALGSFTRVRTEGFY